MPAVSESQQRLFGMVHAYQKGKLKNPPKKVKEVAKHISEEDAEHFARTKHKGLPEKKAYTRGFMDKLAEFGMTKEAKSLARLLARVGPDLAGATERDLKFLARRGFKGLTPKQVTALREKKMLPTVNRVLTGFNRGTNNMFRGIGTGTDPIRTLVRRKGMRIGDAHVDPLQEKAFIPGVSGKGTLADREMRAAVARHEAREWVRGVGLKRSSGMTPEDFSIVTGEERIRPTIANIHAFGDVGTSHLPGVMHDERIFRSQLSNMLGIGTSWDKMPLSEIGRKGERHVIRGARDAYIGSKPLKYDYDIRKDMLRRYDDFMAKATGGRDRMVKAIIRDRAKGDRLVGIGDYIGKIRARFPGLTLSDKELRSLLAGSESSVIRQRPAKVLSETTGLKSMVDRYRRSVHNRINKALAKHFGVPSDRLAEGSFMPIPKGSEIEFVSNLSPMPGFGVPDTPPRKILRKRRR